VDALLAHARRLIGSLRPVEHVATFERWEDKAAWLHGAAERDAADPVVRALAWRFVAAHPDPVGRARAIQRWVRDAIRYVRDPKKGGRRREQFASSRVILWRGQDDCDGKARLFVALCLAAGLTARIRPVVQGGEFVHVQGEVLLPGGWTCAELILRGVELGQGIEAAQRDAHGRAITT
jgi:transglutaminase-like putative cysteine protease